MKTQITIEDGKVSIQIDDGKQKVVTDRTDGFGAVPVENQGGVMGRLLIPAALADPSPKETRGGVEPIKAEPVAPKVAKVAKKPDDRKCDICGGSMEGAHSNATLCLKKECRTERQRRYQNKWLSKKNAKTGPVAEPTATSEENVRYCKYCLAWTTHDTAHHDSEPVTKTFLPGHEKTPDEIKEWKRSFPTETIKNSGTRSAPTGTFADPWDCLKCRTSNQLCGFHASMEADGKTPPKYKAKD